MISWELWRALQQPPRTHFLYKQIHRPKLMNHSFADLAVVGIVALGVVVIIISKALATAVSFMVLLVVPLMALRFSVLFGLTGMANGLRWAVASGQALTRFRRSGFYELLCLTPPGALGVNWAISTGVFYNLLQRARVQTGDLWALRMYLILPLTYFLTAQISESFLVMHPLNILLIMLFNFVLVVVWFRLEDAQSTTLGGLIGMLVPTYTRRSWEVRIGATGLYSFIQLSIYTLGIVCMVSIFPQVFRLLAVHGWLINFSNAALALTVIAVLREIINQLLWRNLVWRLDSGVDVITEVIHGVY